MKTTKQRGVLRAGRLAMACCWALAWGGAAGAELACLDGVAPLLKDGRHGEALARLDACPAQSADDAQVLLTKGRALALAGRQEDALAVFGRLVEVQPKSASALNNLAVVQAKLGRLLEARASLEKAVEIAPDFALAQENLADIYVRLARADYEKVAARADAQTQVRVKRKLAAAGAVLARATPDDAIPAAQAIPAAPVTPVVQAAVLPPRTFAQKDREAAIAMVTAWAADWSAGNWTGYRGHYDAGFVPEGGRSFAAWEAERRGRVANKKDIQVTLSEVDVMRLSEETAEVRFVQSYASPQFVDWGRKTLSLVRRPQEGWRIVRESFEVMSR